MNLLLSTLLPQAAAAPSDFLAMAADIAMILIGIFALVGTVLGIMLLGYLRRVAKGLERTTRRIRGQAEPLVEHGKGIAANVEFITATVRTDVEKLNASVQALSDRLKQASDRMEERIEEFNALMEVVQGEAEDVFLDTAATVRGVQAGASRLTGSGREPGRRAEARDPHVPRTGERDAPRHGHHGDPLRGVADSDDDGGPSELDGPRVRPGSASGD